MNEVKIRRIMSIFILIEVIFLCFSLVNFYFSEFSSEGVILGESKKYLWNSINNVNWQNVIQLFVVCSAFIGSSLLFFFSRIWYNIIITIRFALGIILFLASLGTSIDFSEIILSVILLYQFVFYKMFLIKYCEREDENESV